MCPAICPSFETVHAVQLLSFHWLCLTGLLGEMRSEMCVCVCVWAGQGCASVRLGPGETTRAREKIRDMGWGRKARVKEGWGMRWGKILYCRRGHLVDVREVDKVLENTYLSEVPRGLLMSSSGGECRSDQSWEQMWRELESMQGGGWRCCSPNLNTEWLHTLCFKSACWFAHAPPKEHLLWSRGG